MPTPSENVPKPRKPRPSRARGLRTTTGCLTCRKRRVKCDEQHPRCVTCAKSDRECMYGPPGESAASNTNGIEKVARSASSATETEVASAPSVVSPAATKKSFSGDVETAVFTNSPELMFDSPLTSVTSLPSPNSAPREWYGLLAEDAVNHIDKHNLNLDVERPCLSRRQSPAVEDANIDPRLPKGTDVATTSQEEWNSVENLPMTDDEFALFQHYVSVIGPILDLSDPGKQFSTTVARLAVRNVGVLKSLLAVAARHRALMEGTPSQPTNMFVQTPGSDQPSFRNSYTRAAAEYYHATLHYLSRNLLYPSYSKSQEIIATALLISTYEMFDAEGQRNHGAWERHLRGIFWIQRSQNNNGECKDMMRRAAWWCWLRQDIWVAFREGRRVLTIWRPTRRLMDLSPDELCLRIIYICGRCVDYAANEKKYDINTRINQGKRLRQALDDWFRALPYSFHPIYEIPSSDPASLFPPIWIHPPSFSAAVQTFHFARIIVLINQPSVGGMEDFLLRKRCLDESVETICGIASSPQAQDLPSAFVNFQALFVAGLCVQNSVKQDAVLRLLSKTLDITKSPPKTLLDDLTKQWGNES